MSVCRSIKGALLWLVLIGAFASCKPKQSDIALDPGIAFRQLDSLLRTESFDHDAMQALLANLRGNFPHVLTKEKAYHTKSTHVTYRWNSDSALVMIDARKGQAKGFSREVILHSGDSILFTHRFNTAPLDIENPEDYTFLEAVYYLKNTGTIKHVGRISYGQSALSDTTTFLGKTFSDLADPRYHYYSLELGYARNIFED